jgi:hypothetical protein
LRIVYVGSFTRIQDEEGIARSLEFLGHTVIRYEEAGFIETSIQNIIDDQPDLVLFAKLKFPMILRMPFIRAMRKAKIPMVCWVPDLYIGMGREMQIHSDDSIFRADFVFTPDGGHDKEWKAWGVNHYLLRQGIYHEECVTLPPDEQEFKVIFIGTANEEFPYRRQLMLRLSMKYGDDFRWLGRVSGNEYRGERLSRIISSTPIVIGDSVYSPHYWSNRVYETIGRGGFIIHPNIQGLEKEFTYYKHMVPYDYEDFDGLFEKIDYYLRAVNERKYIAKEGQEHVRENHTLIHRCRRLLEVVS